MTNQMVTNQKHTIKSLRMAGYKVRTVHIRLLMNGDYMSLFEIRSFGYQGFVENNGGETVIDITTPDMKYTVTAVAECSKKDGYNKKIGIAIALGRAIVELQKLGYLTS